MKLTRERRGELFIFAETTLFSLFPVVTILSYNRLSPLISLAASTLFAAFFFAIVLTIKKGWRELRNDLALKDILLATFFIGVLYYLLYFFGLRYTSAGNASIIALTEVFFSYLFFHIWRKDHIPTEHVAGALLIVIGASIVLYPNFRELRLGDLLVLAAAFVAPFGNFFAQRARKLVSSETIMFLRSFISAMVIFGLVFTLKTTVSIGDLRSSFFFIAVNGILLLGLSKVFWIEGIHRITVTKANALSSMSPLLTLFFAWIFLSAEPTPWQLLSFIPMFFGVVLLSRRAS